MNKVHATASAIMLVLGTVALSERRGRSAPTSAPASTPVLLKDLEARGVAGTLGEPLGKIVSVHGTMVVGNGLDFKDAQGRIYVKANRVADRALEASVLLEVRPHFLKDEIKLPPDKASVTLTGWETGAYDGIVDHEFDFVPGYAGTAYHFRTWFVVVKTRP